ncbi:MAG: M20/M25/M40 family metallo-hydrolase [Flavobacteriales bacterium]|jgi:hypothetical protein
MKKYTSFISVITLVLTFFWSYSDLMPSKSINQVNSNTEFSIENALTHLKVISKEPHYTGSQNHLTVQNYIVNELKKMGLNPEVQNQVAVNKWRSSTNTANITASIKGYEKGKSLVLLSHYDSRHHSSLGASDAGSGVVTILEGVRAFLAKNKTPKNDIHIVFTDAEEIGLIGAQAFINYSPLATNIGLVINYEARGSGGPSYMLMETNGKNSQLLTEFIKAKPNYPAANSLMYSIYKMLPNDTDLTIFRKYGDINGLNFAFIGDHFDYHTEQDSFERIDLETLLHQADYFTTTLDYFAYSDLSNLNSDIDQVYTNFPFITLLHFPFSWILPMLIFSIIIFIFFIFIGIKSSRMSIKSIVKGFIPFTISLVTCLIVSFLTWKLLVIIYPNYNDILHGFTYNGYQYIVAFSFLNFWIVFKIYKSFFVKHKGLDLLVAPLFFWIIINFLIFMYLKGAAYFIIPVYFSLVVLGLFIFLRNYNSLKVIVATLLSVPLVYMFAPQLRMFPVGLGLSNLFITGFFIVLIFGLLIPVFQSIKSNKLFVRIIGFCSFLFFLMASFNSNYNENNRKPNSIVFINDLDKNESYWASYDHVLDDFTQQFFEDYIVQDNLNDRASNSKYNNSYKHYNKTHKRDIKSSTVVKIRDSIGEDLRYITLIVKPQRSINKISFYSDKPISFENIGIQNVFINRVDDIKTVGDELKSIRNLFTYYYTPYDDQLKVDLVINKKIKPSLKITETSFDLLSNPFFNIKPRAKYMMAMPFVVNDAIITKQKINL